MVSRLSDTSRYFITSLVMKVFRFGFEAMGGFGEVLIGALSEKQGCVVAKQAIDEVARVERKYSRYRSGSIVSRINDSAGSGWVECDEETISLFGYADALFANSDGLFDITAGILRKAWDFSNPIRPDLQELRLLIEKIGWDKVERKESSVRLPIPGMEIDFGGFAKEYAADRAAALLHCAGVRHGYVNLAGDIRVVGPKPDGEPWLIGIRHPRDPDLLIASLPLTSGALATSGDYERYIEIEGNRYCHVLNPRTGMPVREWQSVSVSAPLAVHAGSCTTIAMLKESEALPFLETSAMTFLAVDRFGVVHRKSGEAETSTVNIEP